MPAAGKALGWSIHAAHLAWMAALVSSVDRSGAVSTYSIFAPLLALAVLLELGRWTLLAQEQLEIKGTYSHASALDALNRSFLAFSWYVVPLIPPFALLERHAARHPAAMQKCGGQVFARFWLKSEVTLPAVSILLLVLVLALSPDTPPNLLGLGRHFAVACVFWIVEFGLVAKLAAVLVFSILVRIFKGL